MEWTREIEQALMAPFPEDEVEFLPRAASGGRALALAHIDARSVMRRLDAVVGPQNWSFDFDMLSPDGKKVKGRLTVLGVTKCDAGEAEHEDEPLKAAVSDALKRCGVHFGIGRYLYYLPQLWADFDPQKRRFASPPRLPAGAVERALAVCGWEGVPAANAQRSPAPVESRGDARATGADNGSHGRKAAKRHVAGAERESYAAATQAEKSAAPGAPEKIAAGPAAADDIKAARKATAEAMRTAGRWSDDPAERSRDLNRTLGRAEECADPLTVEQWRTAERHYRDLAAAAGKTPAAPPVGALVCAGPGCGKPLTPNQQKISERAFGKPLCPTCQREQARAN